MLEIPESKVIGIQIEDMLAGKTIAEVRNATNIHKFTWFLGDPITYPELLMNKSVEKAEGHGAFVDIHLSDDTHLTVGDGTNLRFYGAYDNPPQKYQLAVIFDDRTSLIFTVAMYGGIFAYKGFLDNKYYQGSINSISPLTDGFDETYFEGIFRSVSKNISIKALLATEQRIPGLGNGVLQDILFNARIHPKRKIQTLSDFEKGELFHSLKVTLASMTDKGGRDTEKDLLGQPGKHKTILSKNTYTDPCPVCGSIIIKEAYLGGAVYYCPTCQKI